MKWVAPTFVWTEDVRVHVPIFDQVVYVWHGLKEFRAVLEGMGIEERKAAYDGRTLRAERQSDGASILLMYLPRNAIRALVWHEFLHASAFLLGVVGVPSDNDSHEMLAYLQGFMVQAYDEARRKKK